MTPDTDPPDRSEERGRPDGQWPSVALAYAFVQPSYQLVSTRFEAADGRLTTVMTLASSLTLGVPLFGKSIRPTIQFDSPWFLAAVVLFITAMVIGILGRVRGGLVLLDPGVLYREWLHKAEWEFMKDAVYYAGEHFDCNAKAIRRKSNTSLAVAGLLALEILLLVGWIAR